MNQTKNCRADRLEHDSDRSHGNRISRLCFALPVASDWIPASIAGRIVKKFQCGVLAEHQGESPESQARDAQTWPASPVG